jgi:starvation-inducible DNA-binding protein
MEDLQKITKIAFASEFTFYLKAHFFHWNVEGPLFKQFHDLFGDIYEEVYDSIDPFAENIRKLGAYTPGSYTRFSALSQLDEETKVVPAEQMTAELLEDSDMMVQLLKRNFDAATAAGEEGLADFLAQRMDAHRKHSWMLRATLK